MPSELTIALERYDRHIPFLWALSVPLAAEDGP